MSLHFELKKAENGQFSFSLKDEDGKTLVMSEQYVQKANAIKGIESVKKNGVLDQRFELKESTSGKSFFNVKASNGQVVGTSTMYKTDEDRAKIIDIVKAGVADAETREV